MDVFACVYACVCLCVHEGQSTSVTAGSLKALHLAAPLYIFIWLLFDKGQCLSLCTVSDYVSMWDDRQIKGISQVKNTQKL